MKILVAGATGAIGRQLVPRLVAAGHDVTGMVRSDSRRDAVEELGAQAVTADALVAEEVAAAVAHAHPDVIVHELTAIRAIDIKNFDSSFEATNRLRTQGTDHLLSAGQAIGVKRFIAQSYAGWPFERQGAAVKRETDGLDPTPVASMRQTLDAIKHLENAVTGAAWTEGIVLRYGGLYGPGTSLSKDGDQAQLIASRKFPLVGSGDGLWSFVHVADAAEATVAAVERGERGIYQIVDDEPAPVREWLPAAAQAMGARQPYKVPRWLGRIVAGEAAAAMMTEVRGASNAKAKADLGWQPAHPSWRAGFAAELA
ncbi:MAG: NAD(P)-dependent oxidoreductase [Solirubrobacteraceae bacterium]|jgi:nucleoside-diphosphate-sugar epimerase